jgi:hypothetical protein
VTPAPVYILAAGEDGAVYYGRRCVDGDLARAFRHDGKLACAPRVFLSRGPLGQSPCRDI